MRKQLIKIFDYLNGEVDFLKIKVKRYKLGAVAIALFTIFGLESYSVIRLDNTKAETKIKNQASKDLENLIKNDYDTILTYISQIELEFQVSAMKDMYENDLSNSIQLNISKKDKEERAKLKELAKSEKNDNIDKVFNNLNMSGYMDNLGKMFSFDIPKEAKETVNKVKSTNSIFTELGKYAYLLKPTTNNEYKENMLNILKEINSKHSELVISSEDSYVIQKYPKKEDVLTSLTKEFVKHNYIIYTRNIPIGYILTKDNKITLHMLNLESQELSIHKDSLTYNQVLDLIPKGFPNMIVVFEDGTIDISESIVDMLGIDRMSTMAALCSNIRVVESSLHEINIVKPILDRYNVGK